MADPADERAPKPRRWLAILLSIGLPGLGHAYAGVPVRGFVLAAALTILALPLVNLLARAATPSTLVMILAVSLAIPALLVVDAFRAAGRLRTRFTRRGSVLLVCLGYGLVWMPVVFAVEWWSDRELPQSYYAPSAAMLPTLLIGDHFFVDPRAYRAVPPSRGDIVVYRAARSPIGITPRDRNPDLPAESFIKRIVGLPGDAIRFEGPALYVNGELKTGASGAETFTGPQGESFEIRPETLGGRNYLVLDDVAVKAPSFATVVVEPRHYFLAGDNRDNSNDSRYFGTVHADDIVGSATKVYWSWDYDGTYLQLLNPSVLWTLLRDKTRWERIGRPIE